MKLIQVTLLASGLMTLAALAQDKKPEVNAGTNSLLAMEQKPTDAPDKHQLSEAVGLYFARSTSNALTRADLDLKTDLDAATMIDAFTKFLAGSPPPLTDIQESNLLRQITIYKREQVAVETKKVMATAAENKTRGTKFLEENALAPGVKVLTNGLQYKVLAEGNGPSPTSGDVAKLTFRVTLVDGTEVIAIEHREISLAPPNLPAGVLEALHLMKAGSKWIIYLPYQLAYGEQTAFGDAMHPPKVGPESALIFETELEGFRPRPQPQTMSPMAPAPPPGTTAAQITGSAGGDIIRVPSTDEMKRGSQPHVMTPDEIKAEMQKQTNTPAPK